jgi:hypothetical protein
MFYVTENYPNIATRCVALLTLISNCVIYDEENMSVWFTSRTKRYCNAILNATTHEIYIENLNALIELCNQALNIEVWRSDKDISDEFCCINNTLCDDIDALSHALKQDNNIDDILIKFQEVLDTFYDFDNYQELLAEAERLEMEMDRKL